MKRIIVLNNYPFDTVWDEVRRGDKPDHHLYGINYFERRGYEVIIAPSNASRKWNRMNTFARRIPLPLGDLMQQYWTIKNLRKDDIIYAPCETQANLLCLGRGSGLLRSPVVCIAHHPFHRGRMSLLRRPYLDQVIRGADYYLSLSNGVAQQMISSGGRSLVLKWGPDANYYHPSGEVGHGVLAAGRTGRDFLTFAAGAARAGIYADIICLQPDAHNLLGLPYIHLQVQPVNEYMGYPRLMKAFNSARALAIPLYQDDSLAGLTSLMDALGMAKPVICTRNPLLDIDIEKEGIGFWVEPGDVDGWSRAITFFDEHPDEARAMGLRARKLVDAGLNSEFFASQVLRIFESVYTGN